MPVFKDPSFPQPGTKPGAKPGTNAVFGETPTIQAASRATSGQVKKPTTKPTWTPPPTRTGVTKSTAIQSRMPSMIEAAPLKAPTKTPLNEPYFRPSLEKAILPLSHVLDEGTRNTANSPTSQPTSENVPKPAYEPYNPYPPRKRKAATVSNGRQADNFAFVGVLVGVLIIAGTLLVSTFFIQKFAERQIAKAIHKSLAPYESVARVSFSGVHVSVFKRVVTLKNIEVELAANDHHPEETITIDRARVWGIDWKTLRQIATTRKPVMPATLKFSVDKIQVPTELFGLQAQTVLHGMGYDALTMSMYADSAINQSQQSFDLKDLRLTIANVGEIAAEFSFGHLKVPTTQEIARFKADPKLILSEGAEFLKATIRGFEVSYHDSSFISRASRAMVAAGEASPADLAQMALLANSGTRMTASAQSEFVKPALATLVLFLRNPGTLTLMAQPADEVALASLFDEKSGGSINELAAKLNMSLQ